MGFFQHQKASFQPRGPMNMTEVPKRTHRRHTLSPSSAVTESSTLSLTPVRAPPTVRRALPIHTPLRWMDCGSLNFTHSAMVLLCGKGKFFTPKVGPLNASFQKNAEHLELSQHLGLGSLDSFQVCLVENSQLSLLVV
ncbi:hypothetical protein SO802_008329 [Lithocarpus litseifolius]|uniref:Uncharacterized protein n=1 Tax=Lithocarpus litseifolius TaxID=425828 RepID=A0AAW2DAF4_9ROSI